MDSNKNVLYAAGLPALISTGITFIYFLLKACHYVFYAISHKTEGRLAAATPGSGQQEYGPIMRKEGHTEVYEQIAGDNSEQYGTGTQRPSGSLPVPRRQQDICLSSHGDAAEYPEEPPFRQNAKRLQGRRHRNTTDYYGEGPGGTYANSTGVFTESGSLTNASDGQPSDDERTGRKERPDENLHDGVQGHRASKTQVSHVALQTDTCDTLYVTKNTLTAYTIAIVQNSQALQYDQMHSALQTARNQASLEMPLRAEELLTAHFNLAVLADQKDVDRSPDAQKPMATTQDAEPHLKKLKYLKTLKKKCVNSAKPSSADAQHLCPRCRAHQYHQCLPILVMNRFPSWWQAN